jgi:hypothetical protein
VHRELHPLLRAGGRGGVLGDLGKSAPAVSERRGDSRGNQGGGRGRAWRDRAVAVVLANSGRSAARVPLALAGSPVTVAADAPVYSMTHARLTTTGRPPSDATPRPHPPPLPRPVRSGLPGQSPGSTTPPPPHLPHRLHLLAGELVASVAGARTHTPLGSVLSPAVQPMLAEARSGLPPERVLPGGLAFEQKPRLLCRRGTSGCVTSPPTPRPRTASGEEAARPLRLCPPAAASAGRPLMCRRPELSA